MLKNNLLKLLQTPTFLITFSQELVKLLMPVDNIFLYQKPP